MKKKKKTINQTLLCEQLWNVLKYAPVRYSEFCLDALIWREWIVRLQLEKLRIKLFWKKNCYKISNKKTVFSFSFSKKWFLLFRVKSNYLYQNRSMLIWNRVILLPNICSYKKKKKMVVVIFYKNDYVCVLFWIFFYFTKIMIRSSVTHGGCWGGTGTAVMAAVCTSKLSFLYDCNRPC